MRAAIFLGAIVFLAGCQPARSPSEACRRQNMAKRIGRSGSPNPQADALEDIRCDEMEREEQREAREEARRAAQARTSVPLPPQQSDPPRAKMATPPAPAVLAMAPRHFECQSHPSGGNATRSCLPSDVNHLAMCTEGGGCFSQDWASCFFASRSRDEMMIRKGPLPTEEWSLTEVGQKCFATAVECDTSHDKIARGTAAQPPVRSPCMPITPREATSDP